MSSINIINYENIIFILSLSIYFFLFSAFIILSLIGRYIGFKGAQIISCLYSFFAAVTSILLFLFISVTNLYIDINLFNWISIELFNVNIGLLINSLTVSMLVIITLISFLAQLYSIEYMSSDPHKIRFYSYLLLFTLFMVVLVTSNNLVQLFLGWEGVGVCSYLLVNFWFIRFKANKSSLLAIIVNKIGDLFLMIAILLIQYVYKNTNLNFINISSNYFFELNSFFNKSDIIINIKQNSYNWDNIYIYLDFYNLNIYIITSILEFISLFIIIASVGKSAQFGLHIWLPEAMEGPTPVSSLIHAATMVTAGIFLIIRVSYIYIHVNNILLVIIFIGSVTIIVASTIAINQIDIKKMIAYSTCSQLGYMFMSCGFFAFHNSLFHLLMHAFFKALLFLTAGYIIHLFSNNQDIRLFKNIIKINPFGYINLGIGSLTIIGTPFLSGFYSKEIIIELLTLSNYLFKNYYLVLNIVLIFSYYTIQITSIYSLKGLIQIFFKRYNGYKWVINNIHYPYMYSILPLFILSICSIILGYLMSDQMIGFQTDFWGNSFYYNNSIYENYLELYSTNSSSIMLIEIFEENKIIASSWTLYIIFIWIIIIVNNLYYNVNINSTNFLKKYLKNIKLKNIYIYINTKYIIMNKLLLQTIHFWLTKSLILFFYIFDKGIIEFFGPYGLSNQLSNLIKKSYKLNTGFLYHYLGFILIVIIVTLYNIFIF